MHKTILLSLALSALTLEACTSAHADGSTGATSSSTTSAPRAHKEVVIPSDAIQGDFDGDGSPEYVWIEGTLDEDDYLKGQKAVVKSSNPRLRPKAFAASRGIFLENLGNLDGSGCDALGIVPYSDSSWTMYHVYSLKGCKWHELLDPFCVHLAEDDIEWVQRSSRPGYARITWFDMSASADPDDPDNAWIPRTKEVKLK